MTTIHENYTRNEIVTGASDRSFGIVMTAAFTLMSLLNWWHQEPWRKMFCLRKLDGTVDTAKEGFGCKVFG